LYNAISYTAICTHTTLRISIGNTHVSLRVSDNAHSLHARNLRLSATLPPGCTVAIPNATILWLQLLFLWVSCGCIMCSTQKWRLRDIFHLYAIWKHNRASTSDCIEFRGDFWKESQNELRHYSASHHDLPKVIFLCLWFHNFMWVWSIFMKFGQVVHLTIVVTQTEVEAILMVTFCAVMLWPVRYRILHSSLVLLVGASDRSESWWGRNTVIASTFYRSRFSISSFISMLL